MPLIKQLVEDSSSNKDEKAGLCAQSASINVVPRAGLLLIKVKRAEIVQNLIISHINPLQVPTVFFCCCCVLEWYLLGRAVMAEGLIHGSSCASSSAIKNESVFLKQ